MSVQRRRGAAPGASSGAPQPAYDDRDARKIGYDPEDAEQTRGGEQDPALTLMEEVLLLGLDDEEGQLSFWNDGISYVLRGCIMLELALRGRIGIINDPARQQHPLADRKVELLDARKTGDVLLDETIDLMGKSEPMGVQQWVDALSGETWNLSKIGYQLKQVRERLCKGLVDKKICRTSKKSYLLFDMATHPVVDYSAKHDVAKRLHYLIDATTFTPDYPSTKWYPGKLPARTLRLVALAVSAQSASVLENVYQSSSFDARDNAFLKIDELLLAFGDYPFALRTSNPWVASVFAAAQEDARTVPPTRLELFAAVLQTYAQLDSLV